MRAPGYECLDRNGAGRPYESASSGREQRQAVDVGRPRGAGRASGHGPDAATRAMQADWQTELMKMKTRLLELQS